MEWVRFALVAVLMTIGVGSYVVGVLGIFRFRFVLNRMHAAAILDSMGLFFIIVGLCVARGFDPVTLKLILIFVFLWMTSPIASHLLAKMEYITDENLKDEVVDSETEEKNGAANL